MSLLKKKKKSTNIFSKDFYIDNQGDIFCMILVVITLTQYFGFLKSKTQQFVWVQYESINNQTNIFEGAKYLYKLGGKDYATLFSAIILSLVYICAIEEYLVDKYVSRLKLSNYKAYECRLAIFSTPYLLLSTIYHAYALYKSHIHLFYKEIFNFTPAISVHYKILMLFSMAFWFSMFVKIFISRAKSIDSKYTAFIYMVYFFVSYNLYLIGLFHYGLIITLLNSIIFFSENLVFFTTSIGMLSFLRILTTKIHYFVLFTCSFVGTFISLHLIKINVLEYMQNGKVYLVFPRIIFAGFMILLYINFIRSFLSKYSSMRSKKATKDLDLSSGIKVSTPISSRKKASKENLTDISTPYQAQKSKKKLKTK